MCNSYAGKLTLYWFDRFISLNNVLEAHILDKYGDREKIMQEELTV